MLMVDTSWANLMINYDLTNILLKLMGCIVCYILHNLITLRHQRGYFPSSDLKSCKISSDISRLLLNNISENKNLGK